MDEDWHAICQAIYKGVERAEREKLHCKFEDRNKAINVLPPVWESQDQKTLWKIRQAKEKEDACYDQDSEQQIVSRETVRQTLWDKHLQNPTMARDEALRRVAGGREPR